MMSTLCWSHPAASALLRHDAIEISLKLPSRRRAATKEREARRLRRRTVTAAAKAREARRLRRRPRLCRREIAQIHLAAIRVKILTVELQVPRLKILLVARHRPAKAKAKAKGVKLTVLKHRPKAAAGQQVRRLPPADTRTATIPRHPAAARKAKAPLTEPLPLAPTNCLDSSCAPAGLQLLPTRL